MTYPDRLKAAMDKAGLNQKQLADAMGVDKQTVNSCIVLAGSNKDRALSAENSARAARVLGVDHHWLATGEGEANPVMMVERMALSSKAVYIGDRFDAISDPQKRRQAYAMIVQFLDFSGSPPRTPPPESEPT